VTRNTGDDVGVWSFSSPPRSRSRRAWAAGAIVSATLLVAIPAAWLAARPPAEVGVPPWLREDGHARERVLRATEGDVPAIGARSARPADLQPLSMARPPLRLNIPELGVDAPIVPIGVETSGTMEVPDDVGTVGWYGFGPSPGLPGSTVLVGHVDSRLEGPGVFFGLSRLRVGDRVSVRVAEGGWESFRVVARALVEKDHLPQGIFMRKGDPVLTLITCGGGFDQAEGRYTHNVIVSAVRAR
jgi:sortase (surface protein transpeptidase)